MLLEKVKNTIRKYRLLQPGDKILLAYSGGVDSSALLHLFLDFREELEFELFLGHFNHGLRKEADRDEIFVRQKAKELSLPLFVSKKDIRREAKEKGINLEEAARLARYEFLRKKAAALGEAKIATAHNLNDQAETFFLRLFRGSGHLGLAGIFPRVEGKMIRPFIEVSRKEVEEFLQERKISFRIDRSNYDCRFRRNKIRLELIPYLEKNFDSNLLHHIGQLTSILREEEEILEELTRKKGAEAVKKSEGRFYLDAGLLQSTSQGLARRLVRFYLELAKGDIRGISYKDVESVLKLVSGKEHPLSKDLVIRREKGRIELTEKLGSPQEFYYRWDGFSPLVLEEAGLVFRGERLTKKEMSRFKYDDSRQAVFDMGKINFPLTVRSRKEGDRYQPLNSPGRKKLKELMRARDIPRSERSRQPVFLSGDRIIWVLGLPVSEEFKVKPETKDIFLIRKV